MKNDADDCHLNYSSRSEVTFLNYAVLYAVWTKYFFFFRWCVCTIQCSICVVLLLFFGNMGGKKSRHEQTFKLILSLSSAVNLYFDGFTHKLIWIIGIKLGTIRLNTWYQTAKTFCYFFFGAVSFQMVRAHKNGVFDFVNDFTSK